MDKLVLLKLIQALALQNDVDPALVASIVHVESNFKPSAVGGIGERGLMQLHPRYYEGDEYFVPEKNIEAGVKLLKKYSKQCRFKIDFSFVICYSSGVKGAFRVKSPKQNQYYQKVLRAYPTYAQIYNEEQAASARLVSSPWGGLDR